MSIRKLCSQRRSEQIYWGVKYDPVSPKSLNEVRKLCFCTAIGDRRMSHRRVFRQTLKYKDNCRARYSSRGDLCVKNTFIFDFMGSLKDMAFQSSDRKPGSVKHYSKEKKKKKKGVNLSVNHSAVWLE